MNLEQRKLDLINTVCDISLGTLWWIANWLWKTEIPHFDEKHPDGKHPALSLGGRDFTSLYQTVPMLLGSHANRSGFPAKGISADEASHCTLFRIKPYSFCIRHVLGDDPGITGNSFKHKLNDMEKEDFKEYHCCPVKISA